MGTDSMDVFFKLGMGQRERIIKVLERYENANLAAPAARNKIADEILKTFYNMRVNNEANKD